MSSLHARGADAVLCYCYLRVLYTCLCRNAMQGALSLAVSLTAPQAQQAQPQQKQEQRQAQQEPQQGQGQARQVRTHISSLP
jgi:hypothetical protein